MNRFEISTSIAEKTENETKEGSRETFGSQLAEYITGLKLNDPCFLDRLVRDQEIIRNKYHLPKRDVRFEEPGEYERLLREMAKNLNVKIRSKSECGNFFAENIAGGVFSAESNKIGIDIKKDDLESYQSSLGIFEHELIHAFQERQSPRMPVELMEYEAYVSGFSLQFLQRIQNKKEEGDIEEYLDIMFTNLIGGSVNIWYKLESEKRNIELRPEWYKK